MHPPAIGGRVDARFAAVREAFAGNFVEHGERGGAVCVVLDGRVVVDLWGGTRDHGGRPWTPDTLVDVFSVGKALVATAVARLVGERRLDLDEPLSVRWPEFAAGGKASVTLRHVLSHTAGLPAVRAPLPDDAVFAPEVMAAALAAESPFWAPGTAVGYHVNTFGFLCAEVVRRATGRTLGEYLRGLCEPMGIDLHVGLRLRDLDRVAIFDWPQPASVATAVVGTELSRLAYANPATLSGQGVVNTERWRRCEHASANAHGSARGVARLYEALVAGGRLDGRVLCDGAALAAAVSEASVGHDVVLGRPSRFGLGFQLTQPQRPLGATAGAFGHFGAGGSLGFCDPGIGLAFGYVTATMGPRWQNPKNRALTSAVLAAL